MSTTDGIDLTETNGPYGRVQTDVPDALSYELASTRSAEVSATQATAVNDVTNPMPEIWLDEPLEESSRRVHKEHKPRKQSRSKSRHAFSSSTSSIASFRSKRWRRSGKEYQKERERPTGKNLWQSSKSHSYTRSKDKPSSLYKRPREDNTRRIKRQPNKAASFYDRPRPFVSPSLLSVLSALTGRTESSSESNTTVTQASYEGPRHADSVSSTKSQRGHSKDSPSSYRTRDRPRPVRAPSQEIIDVFKFLQTDPAVQDVRNFAWDPPSGSSSASQTPHPTSNHTPATSKVIRNVSFADMPEKEDMSYPDMLHSDSGVSVGGESPEFTRRTNLHYRAASAEPARDEKWAKEEIIADNHVITGAYQDDSNARALPWGYQNGPAFPQPGSSVSPQPTNYNLYPTPAWNHNPTEPSNSPATIIGYELLASKLSAAQAAKNGTPDYIVPLYRRFEPLHHRVLLHLQDEICELEAELRHLDQSIAQSQPYVDDGLVRPASRREDVRFGGNLRYRRTDVLGRICMKLNTYNQALQSYTSVTQKAEQADEDDVRTYKDWLQTHQPIAKPETEFLDRNLDLFRISISSRPPQDTPPLPAVGNTAQGKGPAPMAVFQSGTSTMWALVGPPAALLLTFIAFLVIPTLFGRLIVLSILAGVGYVLLVAADVDEYLTGREMACCIGIYIGVMATIAGSLQ